MKSESEVAQLCRTLYVPMDCSLPGSYVHGIFQARILEWVAILSPGHLPNLRTELWSPALQADTLPFEPPRKPPKVEPQTNGSYKIRQIIIKIWHMHIYI